MANNKHIGALNKLGQSVWYDNISRDILNSGELAQLIADGVSGLTSNPTIFKNAIADSATYDKDVAALMGKGMNSTQICEDLMVDDVGRAADLLLPTYNATKKADGYASIEVSPLLARDAKGTVVEAHRLWGKLKRPNIMIKVPATAECIPAITELLTAGINVNVTLIFSVECYRKVAEAYIAALEARVAKGQPVDGIASVASFFVSRVDTICEKRFDELVKAGKADAAKKKSFEGQIGIANSRLAYEAFESLFHGEQFRKLAAKGAMVQRCLWASTGTKNPAFSPVLYVEELAGKDTVNTMPPQTVKATMAGLTVEPRLHKRWDDARNLVMHVKSLGLPWEKLLVELQEAGVEIFAESFRSLLGSLDDKMKKLAK